jgi:hypothetical protein
MSQSTRAARSHRQTWSRQSSNCWAIEALSRLGGSRAGSGAGRGHTKTHVRVFAGFCSPFNILNFDSSLLRLSVNQNGLGAIATTASAASAPGLRIVTPPSQVRVSPGDSRYMRPPRVMMSAPVHRCSDV